MMCLLRGLTTAALARWWHRADVTDPEGTAAKIRQRIPPIRRKLFKIRSRSSTMTPSARRGWVFCSLRS